MGTRIVIAAIAGKNSVIMSDELLFKAFQGIYVAALIVTVAATIVSNVYANRIASQQKKQIADTNLLAKQLENDNLRLGLELEKEKLARVPRFLTTSEQQAIVDTLAPFAKHGVSVFAIRDAEARSYADRILACVERADWAGVFTVYDTLDTPVSGLQIRTFKKSDAAVDALVKAFENIGATHVIDEQSLAPGYVDILVGLKP